MQETREQLAEDQVYLLYVESNGEQLTTPQRVGECSQTIIHDFPLLFSFFFFFLRHPGPFFLIPLFNSWMPFSSNVYLSCSPVSLSFLCIFFHFFIEVVTLVSIFSLVSIFIDLCIYCFSDSLPIYGYV